MDDCDVEYHRVQAVAGEGQVVNPSLRHSENHAAKLNSASRCRKNCDILAPPDIEIVPRSFDLTRKHSSLRIGRAEEIVSCVDHAHFHRRYGRLRVRLHRVFGVVHDFQAHSLQPNENGDRERRRNLQSRKHDNVLSNRGTHEVKVREPRHTRLLAFFTKSSHAGDGVRSSALTIALGIVTDRRCLAAHINNMPTRLGITNEVTSAIDNTQYQSHGSNGRGYSCLEVRSQIVLRDRG